MSILWCGTLRLLVVRRLEMPHTCTKNYRPKRLDNRPSAKARKETNKHAADALTAAELKVTKKRKRDEREVQRGEMKKVETAESRIEKKVKALNKKLTQIEDLRRRQKAGEELDPQQLKKVESLGDTLEELDAFLSGSRS